MADLAAIQQAVQHNCAISDARYSRDYSLCIYLLRLREFFRWQNHIPFGIGIDQKSLGIWVSDTESHWDEIEETDFQPLVIEGQTFDPFDSDSINQKLLGGGLFYSAGLGRLGQPHFILAKLSAQSTTKKYSCVELGEELARDTIALPAVAQDKTIIIRHECFTQLIWQMFDEWNIKKADGPMKRLAGYYNLKLNDQLPAAIDIAAHDLGTVLVRHETGEIAAGEILGAEYQWMTYAFHGKPGEMQIRAVRDLLADALSTWPHIAQSGITDSDDTPLLDFWLAGLNGYREKIFKQTNPDKRLFSKVAEQRLNTLSNMIDSEQSRWQTVATQLLMQYRAQDVKFDVNNTIAECLKAAP